MLDPEELADLARKRILRTVGYEDLADFYVMYYDRDELIEMGEDLDSWVGQYVCGSIDSAKGAIVCINLAAVEDDDDPDEAVVGSICHEMGHALWTLLNPADRKRWRKKHHDVHWGPEEAFADDFMQLTRGNVIDMLDEELFREITKVSTKCQR